MYSIKRVALTPFVKPDLSTLEKAHSVGTIKPSTKSADAMRLFRGEKNNLFTNGVCALHLFIYNCPLIFYTLIFDW